MTNNVKYKSCDALARPRIERNVKTKCRTDV
jgi:hypothetical protein